MKKILMWLWLGIFWVVTICAAMMLPKIAIIVIKRALDQGILITLGGSIFVVVMFGLFVTLGFLIHQLILSIGD